MSRINQFCAATAVAASCLGSASAVTVFQGRLADGTPSSVCTVSGTSKCTMFYDTLLNITILNDWNIGSGPWSATSAAGSAQALAATAGYAASGLTGWVLPTGGDGPAVALNQIGWIFANAGGSFASLRGQFDGVLADSYWSGSEYDQDPLQAWSLLAEYGWQFPNLKQDWRFAIAVRPGDVAAAVPEPQAYAMLLAGFGALVLAVRRRQHASTAL